ncbi:MAG TPA: hypothetical protein DIS96_17065 [Pusillimonas sp.]|nr:hypothetical protein [Pusillimonas sp.]
MLSLFYSNHNSPSVQTIAIKTFLVLMLGALILILPDLAWAQTSGGLARTTSTMEQLRDWLWLIIPVVCLIAGGLLGAAYSMDLIRKDTLYMWTGGVIFAGLVAGGVIELVF